MTTSLICTLLCFSIFVSCVFSQAHMGCTSSTLVEGPQNMLPINDGMTMKVFNQTNGAIAYIVTVPNSGSDTVQSFYLTHVWGSPYQQGFAFGSVLSNATNSFVDSAWNYILSDVEEILYPYLPDWAANLIATLGIEAALDLVYEETKSYTNPDFYEEMQGLSDGSGVDYLTIRRLHMLPGLTKGACSMFGVTGKAVPNPNSLLQLRALDWDMDGPFRDFSSITVYHPDKKNLTQGHAWVNVGFVGFIGALTGMSETQLAISEIGVSFPDASWGHDETFIPIPGIPFIVLLRDILKYDLTVDDSISRMATAKRTCNLILGVGDGKLNQFRAFQYGVRAFHVFDPINQQPLAEWHPRIPDIVYYGMDWECPTFNQLLAKQLWSNYGNITAAVAIQDISAVQQSGDNHVAFYDLTNMFLYVSFAAPHASGGPVEAYSRQYTSFDVKALFNHPEPTFLI